jgi:hypothetical protein
MFTTPNVTTMDNQQRSNQKGSISARKMSRPLKTNSKVTENQNQQGWMQKNYFHWHHEVEFSMSCLILAKAAKPIVCGKKLWRRIWSIKKIFWLNSAYVVLA